MSQNSGKKVLKIEADAIKELVKRVDGRFEEAVKLMADCKGRVIVTGMGKPGFIARKISATLASTGTPSLFLHPAEAIHGDLGMVTSDDIVIAISNSGETEEITKLLSAMKKIGVTLIAMTGNLDSTLAKNADVVLDVSIKKEACPLGLAPTASTTVALAMGDALAVTLIEKKGFDADGFAFLHPGGSLGRKLLRVKDIMRSGESNPIVKMTTTVKEALLKITSARAGSCTIVDNKGRLIGIFTDGDLRRRLETDGIDILSRKIVDLCTKGPMTIDEEKLAAEALHLLKQKKVDELPVVNKRGHVVGLLDVQDLLKAGFV